jgi:hypothetical protein
VERADLLIETGEVKVSGRMDPEKLRSLLHAVTKKCVEIVTQITLSDSVTIYFMIVSMDGYFYIN